MKRLTLTGFIVSSAIFATTVVSARLLAAGQVQQVPLDPRVVVWDQGPEKIDVSKYPPEIKQKYKVFADICSRCHTLARAVNCDFVLEDDWERYIKRMMRRGRNLVAPDDALASYEFAIYDSKIRKKDAYERKVKDAGR